MMLLPGAETAKSPARLSSLTAATSPRWCCHKTAVSTAWVPEWLSSAETPAGPQWTRRAKRQGLIQWVWAAGEFAFLKHSQVMLTWDGGVSTLWTTTVKESNKGGGRLRSRVPAFWGERCRDQAGDACAMCPWETCPWDGRHPPSKRPRLARKSALWGVFFSFFLSTSFCFKL